MPLDIWRSQDVIVLRMAEVQSQVFSSKGNYHSPLGIARAINPVEFYLIRGSVSNSKSSHLRFCHLKVELPGSAPKHNDSEADRERNQQDPYESKRHATWEVLKKVWVAIEWWNLNSWTRDRFVRGFLVLSQEQGCRMLQGSIETWTDTRRRM